MTQWVKTFINDTLIINLKYQLKTDLLGLVKLGIKQISYSESAT